MGFLQKLTQFRRICIQCHDIPDSDTIASAFGVYRYLSGQGVDVNIIYSGESPIKKYNLKFLLKKCGIPLRYVHTLPETDLLLIVDAQYGSGNVTRFDAPKVAIIDHHVQMADKSEWNLIRPGYQSCSTIVWELLNQEGYPVKEDSALSTSLLYGLYIDTSSFADLFAETDSNMKNDLFESAHPLFEQLTKSNISMADMMIATDAMHNHYFDVERRFVIVSALTCEQAVLGVIGDFMIQVDIINLSVVYTERNNEYQFSIRSCKEDCPAWLVAEALSKYVGSGGGHNTKAGGRISKRRMTSLYGEIDIFELVSERLSGYFEKTTDRSLHEPSLCSTTDHPLHEPSLCSTTDRPLHEPTECKGCAAETTSAVPS